MGILSDGSQLHIAAAGHAGRALQIAAFLADGDPPAVGTIVGAIPLGYSRSAFFDHLQIIFRILTDEAFLTEDAAHFASRSSTTEAAGR